MNRKSVDVVLKKADMLATSWFETLDGDPATGDKLEAIAAAALKILSLPPTSRSAVLDSILHWRGKCPEQKTLRKEAWRLAGNADRLLATALVPPWRTQLTAEWCAVVVRSAVPDVWQGKDAWKFEGLVVYGSPAGERLTFMWGKKRCHFMARQFGFGQLSSPIATVFMSGAQFVRFRFEALITPETCRNGRPAFDQVRIPSACAKHNRELLRLRRRDRPETRCKFGAPGSVPCHRCGVGYDRCDRGTAPATSPAILEKIEPLKAEKK